MQPLVEEKVAGFEFTPRAERPGRLTEQLGFLIVVHVGAGPAATGASVFLENLGQDVEFVCLRIEVAEFTVALGLLLGDARLHRRAVVAVKGVTLDVGRYHILAPEDQLENGLDRRGAGTGGAGDGDDGVLSRHRRTRLPIF